MIVIDLRTEYRTNPLGIANRSPRFSWRLKGSRPGVRQTAYTLFVASCPEWLNEESADKWNSGLVVSPESIGIVYAGIPIGSTERCYWKVIVRDETGQVAESTEPAWFETALESEDWKAGWIGWTGSENGRGLCFRRSFTLKNNVVRARAYLAGIGLYEFRLNGSKVGNRVLDPAWTDYSCRVLYATYDITGHLRSGENILGVMVGNGWYGHPILLAQIMVWDENGDCEIIATGTEEVFDPARWQVAPAPITQNSIYDGESYDATLEHPGWDSPGGLSSPATGAERWWLRNAVPVPSPGGKLYPMDMEPIEVIGQLVPIAVSEPQPGIHVFDFGQNIAGWCELQITEPRGVKVLMRFAEILLDHGCVDQANLRSAKATDIYLCRGEDREVWQPRFTYHGFRYVQVEGLSTRPDRALLTAQIVRSAVEPCGDFTCSDKLLTQIHANARWTEGNNLHGVPTDCPQRDERMGWLNDLTVRAEAALHHFRLARLYAKFMDDIADTQDPSGAIADTAPFKWGNRPADPVDVSFALLPWLLYIHYGDKKTMTDHYPHLQAWFNCLSALADHGILTHSLYGDWAPPLAESQNGSPIPARTPGALMSTGYLLYLAGIMSRLATVLDKPEEADFYASQEQLVAAAFNREFWDEDRGVYGSGNQASNTFALWLDVVPEERRSRVFHALLADLDAHDRHITTGNLCTRYLFEVLSREGRSDVAVDILTRCDYPSYGYMIANGATTIWERWEKGGEGMNSYNHPMYGSVALWFYRYLAGIAMDESAPGSARVTIQPHIPPQLSFVRATLTTLRGTVAVSWRRSGVRIVLEVTIPANTKAKIIVPVRLDGPDNGILRDESETTVTVIADGVARRDEKFPAIFAVGSGEYRFISEPKYSGPDTGQRNAPDQRTCSK